MKTIKVPNREEVSPQSQLLFDQISASIGKVPNLYAAIGYSPQTLKGFLQFDGALAGGIFSAKEKEAINLVVSEVNDCSYCLAAHTMLAKTKGFSHEEIISFRKGYTEEAKLNAVIQLAKNITENHGHAEEQFLVDFFAAGFQEDALIELLGLIAVRIFTNYVHAVTGVPIDFPEAMSLK
ncbi:carboxymuconolactone decarboxylase family protein [Pedobacter jamesrossensis]|uniref:Carboxymuconolactone decarboxylase family protein n=1 Tax=Pedobacter jamesrossensis TaxID=1908238 RepID=A0ABV8NN28_9SPHI